MSITPAGSAVAFILLLALPSAWHRAGLRVVPVVVDVNDVFISNEIYTLENENFFLSYYLIDMPQFFYIEIISSFVRTIFILFYGIQAAL